MMRQYLQFNQLLYPLGVRITDLELSDRQAWSLRFSNTTRNGVPIDVVARVGKEDVLARMKRLVAFLEAVSLEGLQEVASLDLRYSNGVAVMPLEPGQGLVQR